VSDANVTGIVSVCEQQSAAIYIDCSRKEYIFIRCYFNNFIFIYCDCIRLHNFCMGAYMDRPADATSLARSHKTAEQQ